MPNSRTVREDLRWLRESSELPATQQSLRAIQEVSIGVLRDLDALTRTLAGTSEKLNSPEVIEGSSSSGDMSSGGDSVRHGCVVALQKAVRLARSSSSIPSDSGDETDVLTQSGGTSEDLDEEQTLRDGDSRISNEGQSLALYPELGGGGG